MSDYTEDFQEAFTKMWGVFARDITLSTVSMTTNDEGDVTETKTTINTKGMVKHITDTHSMENMGALLKGDTILLLKPTESINEQDEITVGSTTYSAAEVKTVDYKGTNIYKRVIMLRKV
ncbi:MAG: hypothetical protein WC444_05540 [Candidatus Paceibacterota bacterium]